MVRYSMELTDLIELVAGAGTSGNNEVRVLTHLFTSGPSDRRALIALTGLSRSGIAQLIDRLDEVGLVTTHRGSADHRTAVSELTASGRRRVRKMEEAFGDYFSSPNPLIKELLDLLQPTSSSVRSAIAPTTPLAALDRLVSFGIRVSAQLDAEVHIPETRQRLALATLADWGDARPGQLADVLGLTSGGITYLVDQLESVGVVERLYGTLPADRRAVLIRLTPSGQTAAQRFADILFEHADELAELLTAAHTTR